MSHSFLASRQRNVIRQKRVHGRIRRPQNRRVRARHAPIRSAHFPGRLGRQRLGQAYATGLTPHGFAAIHREAQGVVKLTFTGGESQRFQPSSTTIRSAPTARPPGQSTPMRARSLTSGSRGRTIACTKAPRRISRASSTSGRSDGGQKGSGMGSNHGLALRLLCRYLLFLPGRPR